MKALPIADSLSTLREKVMAKGFASATGCYVDKASGAMIYDVEGREYIDFTGGSDANDGLAKATPCR